MLRAFATAAFLIIILTFEASQTFAQPKTTIAPVPAARSGNVTELAKSTLAAHGGPQLSGIKTLVIRGSVDITTSAIAQAIPATFSMVFSGEKYRFDLMN